MKPLVLFLIGGSGARFLRSLLFHLAAGEKLININEIKLVIIDTDEANGNYESALRLLSLYEKIRNKLESDNANFYTKDESTLFYHKVSLLDPEKKFLTPLSFKTRTLRDIVDYTNVNRKQSDFIDLMLTKQELDDDLYIGFQGRPNMGTIGLEAIQPAINASRKIYNLLGDDPQLEADGLENSLFFTISSMFGGMGAAGMPMLINKFTKEAYSKIPIGSLTYMQYFKIIEGRGNNDSKYFPQRTKLAYDYYINTFIDKINSLYFIGKSFDKESGVSYAPGTKEQHNQAHYIEFLSITSLIHFCKNIPNSAKPRTLKTYALRAITDDNNLLNASCLGKEYSPTLENYIKLVLIGKYYIDRFEKHYSDEELSEVTWVKNADFSKFSTDERELLHLFFKDLLNYDQKELYDYSGLRVLVSKNFPEKISETLPDKKFQPESKMLGGKRYYDNWKEIEMRGITDAGINSRGHMSRLLAIFDKSFSNIIQRVFK